MLAFCAGESKKRVRCSFEASNYRPGTHYKKVCTGILGRGKDNTFLGDSATFVLKAKDEVSSDHGREWSFFLIFTYYTSLREKDQAYINSLRRSMLVELEHAYTHM